MCSLVITEAWGQKVPAIQNKLKQGEIAIEYIAHASFRVHTQTHSILLDPYADKVWLGYNFPSDIEADAIFSTHPHYDHDGGLFRKMTPYWKDKITLYQDPGNYNVGDILVSGVAGKHAEPYGKEFGQKNTIWIIDVFGIRIVHWGDNGPITPDLLKSLTNVDMLMLPIDDLEHLLKNSEVEEILDKVKPGMLIPMHYRLANLEEAGKPTDLGTIDQFLSSRKQVLKLDNNVQVLSKTELSDEFEILVFLPASAVKN